MFGKRSILKETNRKIFDLNFSKRFVVNNLDMIDKKMIRFQSVIYLKQLKSTLKKAKSD